MTLTTPIASPFDGAATTPTSWIAIQRFDCFEIGLLAPGLADLDDSREDLADKWPILAVYSPQGGCSLEGEGRDLQVRRGDLCLVPAGEVVLRSSDAPVLVLRLPRSTVDVYRGALEASLWKAWPTADGSASLVAHLLDGLIEQLQGYRPTHPERLVQHLMGFIAMMCADLNVETMAAHRQQLLDDAKQFIERHLDDIELTPAKVARSQNVSTRTLHRLFEADGTTIGGWIRHRRLEHCRAELRVAPDHLPVSAIASRWGLWDAAHFSKVFKAAYGVPPIRYRAAARAAELLEVNDRDLVHA